MRRASRRRLEGVFARCSRLRGERSAPRMVYLDGTRLAHVAVVSARTAQESTGSVSSSEVVVGLSIPCITAGSTTLRRRAKRGGVEGDQTYYLANAARIRGKKKINLQTDPPPDLAIEAVYPHAADAAVEVYRRFRVPEVWVCDESGLDHPGPASQRPICRISDERGLPVPQRSEIFDWVSRPQD